MEFTPMGRVITEATIENPEDLWAIKFGLMLAEQARRLDISDALVDTGASLRLVIQGRDCTMEVLEAPDDVPVRISQLPLEHLDLVVDLRSRRLIGNPAHGSEHIYEIY